MKMNFKKGFTLIELLVVVAIIGILASVVLASLSTARGKGNDAKAKSQLDNMRSAAEIYYSTNGHYGTAATTSADCTAGTTGMAVDTNSGFKALVTAANWPGSVAPTCSTDATATTTATKWQANYKLSDATYWCVDSAGASKSEGTTAPASSGGTACI